MNDLWVIPENENIDHVYDDSGEGFRRVKILFKNGLKLSVINGPWAYTSGDDEFEIAIMQPNGFLDKDLLFSDDQEDSVVGHCSIEKVNKYIEYVGAIKS